MLSIAIPAECVLSKQTKSGGCKSNPPLHYRMLCNALLFSSLRLRLGLCNSDLDAQILGSSLHGQGDATTLNVNVHYLNLHNVANLDNLCGRIDVGTASGVKPGLPVMGSTGVVGQVVSCSTYTSEVRLLNDAQSGVAVMLQNSRAEGILSGSVEGVLYLQGVDEGTEVKEGEAVITTGLGGGYFRGLVVGVVSKVEQRQGDATRTIVISPNSSFSNISEVLVVLGMSNDGAASSDTNAANAVAQAVGPDALLSKNSNNDANASPSSDSSSKSGDSSSSDSKKNFSSNSSSEDGE